jgi:hypothetical protein
MRERNVCVRARERERERERERLTRMGMGSSAIEESSKLFLSPIFLQEATD